MFYMLSLNYKVIILYIHVLVYCHSWRGLCFQPILNIRFLSFPQYHHE